MDILDAHVHCKNNREEIEQSERCGCFYCNNIFVPQDIIRWTASGHAICPQCNVDAVLGSKSGCPIEVEFLQRMGDYWFNDSLTPTENLLTLLKTGVANELAGINLEHPNEVLSYVEELLQKWLDRVKEVKKWELLGN